MERLIIIGSDGVPARYGGWETFVEHIAYYLVDYYRLTIVGSSVARKQRSRNNESYKTVYIPIKANGAWSIIYDLISLIYCLFKRPEHVLMLGVSTALFLPFFRPFLKKVYINVDGIEWRREKWSPPAKLLLKFCEKISVKFADVIIADNEGIKEYIEENYPNKNVKTISYGGNHSVEVQYCKLPPLRIQQIRESYLAICRIEPENNVGMILRAAKNSDVNLIFIGNWFGSRYGQELFNEFSQYQKIILLEPIYDLETLYVYRENCVGYIHGHSAGGTNPSLVEIMFHKKTILAFDCIFNRETLNHNGLFFKNEASLSENLMYNKNNDNDFPSLCLATANSKYTWQRIADEYIDLLDTNN